MSKKCVAFYLDVENASYLLTSNSLEKILSQYSSDCTFVIRKAYGNWSEKSVSSHQDILTRLGFELIHCYHPQKSKNSSDIHLSIDVIGDSHTHPEIESFFIVSGDSDFSPVFRALRSMGKHVVGIGPDSILSKYVKDSCKEFIYVNKNKPSDYSRAIEFVISMLQDSSQLLHCSLLKMKLLNRYESFSEKKLGFKNFNSFLKSDNRIQIVKKQRGNYAGVIQHKNFQIS